MQELIELAKIRKEAAEKDLAESKRTSELMDRTLELIEKQDKIITSLLQSIECSVNKAKTSGNAGMALADEFIDTILQNLRDYAASDFGQEGYTTFKCSINAVLHDYRAKAELQKSQYRDFLFTIVTAVTYVFRAFFRLFDVLIASAKAMTGEKYQTKNQTPGYKPFISYPSDETPSSKRIAELCKDVDQAIKELDDVVLHIKSPAP